MATDNGTTDDQSGTGDKSTTDSTSDQGDKSQQDSKSTTADSAGNGDSKSSTPEKLPDDHPLVTALATQKQKLATLTTERDEARAEAAKVTKLEEDLAKRPTSEVVTQLQKRNDRLEAFLSQVGGPLSKALDSRTFTKDLFESEKDVKDIVKDYLKANPTATSTALSAGGAQPANGQPSQSDLLRAAARQ